MTPRGEPVGYVCKQCDGPAPMGVGYAVTHPGAYAASVGRLRCACGNSVHAAVATIGNT